MLTTYLAARGYTVPGTIQHGPAAVRARKVAPAAGKMAPVRDKGPQDLNALAFEPDAAHDPTAKHFIPRAGARKRGLEIAFDPSQHKCASAFCSQQNMA